MYFQMEESPYTLPNSIPPSLVVFSQSGYGDPIRMQRPFSSQVSHFISLHKNTILQKFIIHYVTCKEFKTLTSR